jgi:hypothetical protein
MTAALNPILTLVAVPCLRCGSTAGTVARDRELLGKTDGVCCAPSAARSAPPSAAAPARSLECWFCGADAPEPFWAGKRAFCCRGCAGEWAE